MKALLWVGYGIPDIYIVNDENFLEVREIVLSIVYRYDEEFKKAVEESEYWGELVDIVRENTYGDDSFEKFEICEAHE